MSKYRESGNDTCIHGFATTCDACEKDVNGNWIIPKPDEKVYPKCTNCDAMRLASVSGKCRDLCDFEYHGENPGSHRGHGYGYVPRNVGIGGGDEVALTYCLECGMIQGNEFPISEESVVESFEEC